MITYQEIYGSSDLVLGYISISVITIECNIVFFISAKLYIVLDMSFSIAKYLQEMQRFSYIIISNKCS